MIRMAPSGVLHAPRVPRMRGDDPTMARVSGSMPRSSRMRGDDPVFLVDGYDMLASSPHARG